MNRGVSSINHEEQHRGGLPRGQTYIHQHPIKAVTDGLISKAIQRDRRRRRETDDCMRLAFSVIIIAPARSLYFIRV